MRTTCRATSTLAAAAITFGVVALAGCSTSSSPSVLKPTKAVRAITATTPAPSTTATAPATEEPSLAMAGFSSARVETAATFAEDFARMAMSGCGADSPIGLQHLMVPATYKATLKNPTVVLLDLHSPVVLSSGCVTSQELSDETLTPGPVVDGMPTIRASVTVTEILMAGTTTSPKTLKPVTVSRRFTVDVLPSGTGWLVERVRTEPHTLTTGK